MSMVRVGAQDHSDPVVPQSGVPPEVHGPLQNVLEGRDVQPYPFQTVARSIPEYTLAKVAHVGGWVLQTLPGKGLVCLSSCVGWGLSGSLYLTVRAARTIFGSGNFQRGVNQAAQYGHLSLIHI